MTHIATNVRTLYAQQTTYSGLNAVNAIEMGVVPDGLGSLANWVGYADYISGNPFGGGVNVYGGSSDSGFNIAYTGLPEEACIALATMDWGTPSSSGLIGMEVANYNISGGGIGGSDYTQDTKSGAWYGANHMPITVAEVATKCNCTSDGCTVVWKYQ